MSSGAAASSPRGGRGVVLPLVARDTLASPRAVLEALARREGLKGRSAQDVALVLFVLGLASEPTASGRARSRASTIARAGRLLVRTARVLDMMQTTEEVSR